MSRIGHPGRWTAPAVLLGAVLTFGACVTTPFLTADGTVCDWPVGDSVYGESAVSTVPFGPTCTIDRGVILGGAVANDDLTVGPSPWWSVVAIASGAIAVGAAVRLALRRRSTRAGPGPRGVMTEQAGMWFGPAALWGAVGGAAVLGAGMVVLHIGTWRSSPSELPLVVTSTIGIAAVGLISGLIGGLVLTLPVSSVAAYGERRGWPSAPASYAMVAAAIATPVTWWLWLLGLSSLEPTGRFPMFAASIVSLPIGVVAAGAGATVRRRMDRVQWMAEVVGPSVRSAG